MFLHFYPTTLSASSRSSSIATTKSLQTLYKAKEFYLQGNP
uniref:Uncharacterized protein n=1 Tax=Arundo donax TaxID=35708 RepID=A0A0A8Z5Q7_ARUDO